MFAQPGQQLHSVRATPSRDRVPTGTRRIAFDAVVADRDGVEHSRRPNFLIESRIEVTDVVTKGLVNSRN